MPMLMRGIPAPRAKQRYIINDAGREGRAHNIPFGRIVDPFGEPVKRAFALFAAAAALSNEAGHSNHHEMDFVTAYLNAAWFDGTDITNAHGLKHVVSSAHLDWDALLESARNIDWEALLADNLHTMMADNLWGVPSFRVSGGNSEQAYACWGQDRIWRVENEIARRV
jgi:2-hydroxychromene-2-carboxylate isomerase